MVCGQMFNNWLCVWAEAVLMGMYEHSYPLADGLLPAGSH